MAEADTTQATKKRRAPQGPRVQKPIFLVISYTDENGNPVKLDSARLTVEPTKDTASLVSMLTQGGSDKTVVSITPPSAAANGNPAA